MMMVVMAAMLLRTLVSVRAAATIAATTVAPFVFFFNLFNFC